jgi:AcrR family transcriptional regulator
VVHGSDAAPPRTSRGERTRARLLQATREAIAERGYVAARVEDIVALAGVSHGTFYTYFENKAAALDALIGTTASELQAVVDEPWDGPDGTAAIEAVIGRFVAVFATHAAVVRAWLEASAHDAHFATRLREVRGGYVHRVAEVLAPALEGTRHDPSLAATALVAMVEGAVTQGVADRGPIGQGELVRTLRSLWVGGVVRLSEDGA